MAKHGTAECYDNGCRRKKCVSAHMSAIAKKSVQARVKKYGKGYYSRIARRSHPKNNPDAKRTEYVGGRPPKPNPNVADHS